ncbi:hypothetical protein FH972_021549 [Carpinus fangiana]|uniref:1-phosphatidylinositol 4-kinase n=1 Tax=Carpinus fangiana TaxID=176857 RepID=A0A5N6KRT5_9ROSI|nr:hypothetical protein FH972_021549 [Carpinus fangiana]
MPRTRPAASGYARIAQAEEEESDYHDDSGDEQLQRALSKPAATDPRFESIQPGPAPGMSRPDSSLPKNHRHRRQRTNSGVDIKAINARLEHWAEEIASKFRIRKIKGKSADEEQLEIHHSVFQAPEGIRPATPETLAARFSEHPDSEKLTKQQFDDIVESVKVAIEMGVHPKMITQGSSGSYFARNSEGKTVGVFKPKDEEPYASRNPKWTKWIHRNLFPFFFGRACLIPNLSYVSEAAAYVLDTRLQTNLVPYTDIVQLSSVSFFYDYWERRAYYRRRKPFPHKRRRSFWSEGLQTSFREELEKLVVLDYIMRNTDRGLDNWMIRIDEETQKASIVADFPEDMADNAEPHTRADSMGLGPFADPQGPSRRAKVGAIDNSLSWPWKHPDADSDFQERMFARQIAVMKGQAWNVVETLKTPDHGPLELTRRARVCVWDDLVEIPTVVPMRTSSSETRHQRERDIAGQRDEMDISAALSSAPTAAKGTVSDIPTPNRFNLSRHGSNETVPKGVSAADLDSRLLNAERPPSAPRSKTQTRFSLDQPRPVRPDRNRPRRNLSFSARRVSVDAEDDDGDLGYGAARDMEGNRKKVIVERIEMVKGKPPVFTWC